MQKSCESGGTKQLGVLPPPPPPPEWNASPSQEYAQHFASGTTAGWRDNMEYSVLSKKTTRGREEITAKIGIENSLYLLTDAGASSAITTGTSLPTFVRLISMANT